MKLFVPEPNIDVYNDGFDKHDKLNRKEHGERLSNLVENISDPMVIALDGAWGSGKSVFLKCWVGEHFQPDQYTSRPIYFDAFEHDFMNDPLIALVSVLDQQIQQDQTLMEKGWDRIKSAAPKLLRLGARLGLAVATAGATEIAGAVGDSAIQTVGQAAEDSVENFWASEHSKRDAIKEFREALTEMAAEQKLVIVIDELDRCRPDFALSMLEIVKHLFSVPNVHFLLGVNLISLEHSVRARYGNGIDAAKYLHKFYNLTFKLRNLPNLRDREVFQESEIVKYFQEVSRSLGDQTGIASSVGDLLRKLRVRNEISYRDINQIYTRLACLTATNVIQGNGPTFAILTLLQVLNKNLFDRLIVSFADENCNAVVNWFGFSSPDETLYYLKRADDDLVRFIYMINDQPDHLLPKHLKDRPSDILHPQIITLDYSERRKIFENYVLVPFMSIPSTD